MEEKLKMDIDKRMKGKETENTIAAKRTFKVGFDIVHHTFRRRAKEVFERLKARAAMRWQIEQIKIAYQKQIPNVQGIVDDMGIPQQLMNVWQQVRALEQSKCATV